MELAVDKMYKSGYDDAVVKSVGNKIEIYAKNLVKSQKSIEALQADNLENLVDDIVDYSIEAPLYEYDEDFETEEQASLPPADHNKAIYPGTRVSIDGLKEWIVQTKINDDPVLQAAKQADFLNVNREGKYASAFKNAIDHTAFKVARKIYYVGRKPPNMTVEQWDAVISNLKPVEGSYSENENWGEGGFPYGDQYSYSQGAIDTADPFYKGWTKAGMREV